MLRKITDAFLLISLILVTIPGIKGIDLRVGPLGLGRLQPFKFAFLIWLALELLYLWQQRKTLSYSFLKERWGRAFLFIFVAIDILLFLSLVIERVGGHGWEVLVSLVLGQIAFILTQIDDQFNRQSVRNGLQGATLVLVFFSILELFFPESSITLTFLAWVRDVPKVFYQLGSSLSTVGLTEFCVRAIPLVLFFCPSSRLAQVTAFALVEMLLLTLERSGFLSLVGMLVIAGFLWRKKISWKLLATTTALALVGLFALKSPEQIVGRFLGGIVHIEWKPSQSAANSNVEKPKMMSSQELREYTRSTETSNNERLYLWKMAVRGIRAKPLLGMGLDGFSFRMVNHLYPYEDNRFPEGYHCHNIFLEFAVSGGLLCAFLFASFWAIYGWKALQWRANNPIPLIFLAGQIPSLLLDARIYVSWLAITLFWFAGIAIALGKTRAR